MASGILLTGLVSLIFFKLSVVTDANGSITSLTSLGNTIFLSGLKGLTFYPSGSNGFVDARDVAEFTISLSKKRGVKGRHLLIGENMSFKDLFTTFHHLFGSKKPSIAIPKSLVMSTVKALSVLEKLKLSPLKLTSENLKSAYRKRVYSNQKMAELGYDFRSVQDALTYTNEVYKMHTGA